MLFVAALALAALAWLGSGTAYGAPLGGKIAFDRSTEPGRPDAPNIWVMNADGSCQSRLTDTPSHDDRFPAWSPDGQRIAFERSDDAHNGSGDIYVMSAWGGDQTNLTNGEPAGRALHPTWSPDGERIAFKGGGEIWVMNADGSDKRRIITEIAVLLGPAWSPTGGRIAFSGYAIGSGGQPDWDRSGIFVMNEDGSGVTDLYVAGDSNIASAPAWSPDGQRLAFTRRVEGPGSGKLVPGAFEYELQVMNDDGSGRTKIIEGSSSASRFAPTWAPDGEWIAFSRAVSSNDITIWAIGVDGTGPVPLTATRRQDGNPDWHADDLPPRAQVCFQALTRNTERGVAHLRVRVPGPGRVVLQSRPGVKRFAKAHRESEPGRVVLKVRPRGKALRKLNRTNRVRVRAQVTHRPWVGEPVTKGRRVWLVKR